MPTQEREMTVHSQKTGLGGAVMLCALCMVLTGCGTICNVGSGRRACVYGGVQKDIECIKDGSSWLAPSDIIPLGGGARGAICIAHWAGGIVDMPLSLVGDTLTLPYVLFRRQYRTAGEKNIRRTNRALMAHRFTDGPYVEFASVLASPESYKDRVLRSEVHGYCTGEGLRLGSKTENVRHPHIHVRYWCPGERGSDSNMLPCVGLQVRDVAAMEELAERSYAGDWEINCVLTKSTEDADEVGKNMWGYWFLWVTMESEGDEFVGEISRGQSIGKMRGRVRSDGAFEGTLQMTHGSTRWDSLVLRLSPYGDIAEGVGVYTVAPDEKRYYSIKMRRP